MFILSLLPFISIIILKEVVTDSNLDIFIVPTLFSIIIFCIILISMLYGKIRVMKKEILIEKKIKLENSYIYYRELPNNFGGGICSILIDKNIENEKDIIACILDLCARKYLKLEKVNDRYMITILNNRTDNLLSNEAYILIHLMNNTVGQIDYQEWHQLCIDDGKKLELFENNKEINRSESKQQEITNEYFNANKEWSKKNNCNCLINRSYFRKYCLFVSKYYRYVCSFF